MEREPTARRCVNSYRFWLRRGLLAGPHRPCRSGQPGQAAAPAPRAWWRPLRGPALDQACSDQEPDQEPDQVL